jgi:drug/metabolite transporter (DMT)-like permease
MTSLYAWGAVACIVATSTAGDVLLSRGMKQVGDFDEVRRRSGVPTLIRRVLQNSNFLFGVLAMAIAFYSLLFGLSWGDVSLVVPASTSLTFVTNAIAARFFLHERVDQRRWVAALLVAGGVILLAF